MQSEQTWELAGGGATEIGILVALGLLVLVLAWLDRRQRRRLGMGSLVARLLVIAWLALPLLGFAMWQLRVEPQPGSYTLLVDRSASVALRPQTRDRIDSMVDELSSALERFGRVEILNYAGRGVEQTWSSPTSAETPGGPTHIVHDLNQLSAQLSGKDQTLILISDGADHALQGNNTVTAPVVAVAIPEKDDYPSPLLLTRVESDAYALVRSPLRFTVTVEQAPGANLGSANIEIRAGDYVLGATTTTFAPGQMTATTVLDVLPTREGRQVFTITASHGGVAPKSEFHQTRSSVRVIRDRIRVLHVVGRPSWETRLLREHLRRDSAIDLVSFQILRTRGDKPKAKNLELSLIPFPTKELFTVELPKFDVVFFQDFNYKPYFDPKFLDTLLKNLRNYVIKDGGGFAMTAGDLSFGYGNYHRTPLREIVPVEWQGLGQWNYGNQPLENGEWAEWFGVPVPFGTQLDRLYNAQAKPKSRTVWQSGLDPVLVVGNAGEGRTAALLTDQLWRIVHTGSAGDRATLAGLWSRLVRYLSGDPEFRDVHVNWRSLEIHPGTRSSGTAKPASGRGQVVTPTDEVVGDVDLEARFDFVAPMTATVLTLKTAADEAPEPLIVQYPLAERTSIHVDRDKWQNWAERQQADLVWLEDWRTSGLLNNLEQRSRRVTHRDFIEVQEFWWYWVLGVLLLALEFTIRRAWGGA